MKFKLFCLQRQDFYPVGDEPKLFSSLDKVRKELIKYHSIDNDIEELKALSFEELLEYNDWKVVQVE